MIGNSRFACLTYHVIGEGRNQYTVGRQILCDHMAFLKGEGFTAEGFDGLETRLRSGQALPERYAIVTLDDGDESSLCAADVLAAYGCGATFFLTRDRSEKKSRFIQRPEIRELRRRGFSLGTHGATHQKLTFLPEHRCLAELVESKQWLEDVTGEAVRYWAAPGGYVNRRVRRLAEAQGYVLTGTCREWMNTPGTCALPAGVNRVNIRQGFGLAQIRKIVYGDRGFYLKRQMRAAALYLPKQLMRN